LLLILNPKDNDNSCCDVSLEKPLSSTNLQCFEHHEALFDLYEVYMNEKTFNVKRSGSYIPIPPIKSKCSNFINIIKNSKNCYTDSDCNSLKENKNKRSDYETFINNSTIVYKSNSLYRKTIKKRELENEDDDNEYEDEYEDLGEKEYLNNLHTYDKDQESYCMTPYIPNPFMRVIKFQVNDYPRDHFPHYREIIFLSDPREVWDSSIYNIKYYNNNLIFIIRIILILNINKFYTKIIYSKGWQLLPKA